MTVIEIFARLLDSAEESQLLVKDKQGNLLRLLSIEESWDSKGLEQLVIICSPPLDLPPNNVIRR